MKIAFWCREPNSLSLCAALAGIAYTAAVCYGQRSLVLHSGFNCHELENAFVEQSETLLIREELAYFYDSGIDLILNRLKFEGLGNTGIKEQMLELKKGLLYYLPGSSRSSREIYEEAFFEKGREALDLLEQMYGMVFIACGGDIDLEVNRLVIEKSDVLVVLCEQLPSYNKTLSEELLNIDKDKMFLVGMYDKESKYTVKNIRKELQIKKDGIGVIPYCIACRDALTDGSFISFMEKNIRSTKKEGLFYFVDEIKQATEKILRKAGLYEEKKE